MYQHQHYRGRRKGRKPTHQCPLCGTDEAFWSRRHLNEHLIMAHKWTIHEGGHCRVHHCNGSTARSNNGYPTLRLCGKHYLQKWRDDKGRTNGHRRLGYGKAPLPPYTQTRPWDSTPDNGIGYIDHD